MSEHASDVIERMLHLRTRFEEALAARNECESNPSFEYCLKCDEFAAEEQVGPAEWTRLDCHSEHREYILPESHDSPHISAWVNCINHLLAPATDGGGQS